MKLISFSNPENWFLALLLFLGGCFFQPPSPLEVSTREIERTEKKDSREGEMHLKLMIDQDQRIYYQTAIMDEKGPLKEIRDADLIGVTSIIRAISGMAKNKKKQLVVFLEADPLAQAKAFKSVTEGLRKNEIYKYNLITRPE